MKTRLRNTFMLSLPGAFLLAFVLFFKFVPSAMAEESVNISDIEDCRAINDEQERLLCYDTVMDGEVFNEQQVQQMKVEDFGSRTMAKPEPVAPVPAESSTSSSSTEVAKTVSAKPGKSKKSSRDSLSVTIVKSRKDGNGFYYFQTAEGQVWKQQNARSWTINTPFQADIKAGALGSFFLEVEGSRGTRVKRVR